MEGLAGRPAACGRDGEWDGTPAAQQWWPNRPEPGAMGLAE